MDFLRMVTDEVFDRLENGPRPRTVGPDIDVTNDVQDVHQPKELVDRIVYALLDEVQRLVEEQDGASLDDLATTLDSLVSGLRACQHGVAAARAGKLADAQRSMNIANNLFEFAEKYIQRVR